MIDSGEVGRVTRFESRIEQYTPPDGIPSSGGGILWATSSLLPVIPVSRLAACA
jgi:hypothetical protein